MDFGNVVLQKKLLWNDIKINYSRLAPFLANSAGLLLLTNLVPSNSGVSFNDTLLVGPTIHPPLIDSMFY